jgi:hypothetical protein
MMLTDEQLTESECLLCGEFEKTDKNSRRRLADVIAQAREANALRAEKETWQRISNDVNAAINRAGIYCAVTFAEAVDMITKARDEARSQLHQAQLLIDETRSQLAQVPQLITLLKLGAELAGGILGSDDTDRLDDIMVHFEGGASQPLRTAFADWQRKVEEAIGL